MLVKMDKKGRVTLPSKIRTQAHLRFSAPMRIELKQKSIILKPLPGKTESSRNNDPLFWLLRHPVHVNPKKLKKINLRKLREEMWYP